MQGVPIARRILGAGYPLVLWARRPQTLDPFRNTGATIAATIQAVGAASDHISICVTDDAAVTEVCGQLIPTMRSGSCISIHSTTHPDTCKAIAYQAHLHDVLFVEAPVSGGPQAAAAGALTVMMGGTADAVAAARPVFATFAKLIVHLGQVGNGQIAKLINNTLMAGNLALAHSAVSAGTKLGLDRTTVIDLLTASSGRSYALEIYARQSSMSTFAHSAKLLEKVHLLGEVIGVSNAAYKMLSDAANSFRGE
jgi:3-hydroxyisobutyrate dehydrogenase